MNLHGIVSGAISSVNPMRDCTIQVSTGYTTDADYKQKPTYDIIQGSGQIQPLSGKDLQKLQGLNVQGVQQKAYLNGNYDGCFRVMGKGGDIITFGGVAYLVNAVIERWPDWCAVGITAQVD